MLRGEDNVGSLGFNLPGILLLTPGKDEGKTARTGKKTKREREKSLEKHSGHLHVGDIMQQQNTFCTHAEGRREARPCACDTHTMS